MPPAYHIWSNVFRWDEPPQSVIFKCDNLFSVIVNEQTGAGLGQAQP